MNLSIEKWVRRGVLSRTLRTTAWGLIAAITISVSPGMAATGTAPPAGAAAQGRPDIILATVGDHPITQQEVDARVASQLYDLRKQALDELIDDYVLQRAARTAGLKQDDFVQQQVKLSTPSVTADEAKQFYVQHKAQLDAQTGGNSFDQIKARLIIAMQHQRYQEGEKQLIQKLRAEDHVNVLLQAPHVSIATAGHPITGSSLAPVTIIEFSDFQCPFCRAAESSLKQVRQRYGDQVKLVYMDFPLGFHPHAMDAARAARCAADQDKFWQFHDALFLDQKKLDPANLKQTAQKIGLDPAKFNSCFDSNQHDEGVRKDLAKGSSLGVTGTPTFFINGRELVGAQPPEKFNEIIEEELARAKTPANSREAKAN
jgi:protein-disulfide isomerase